MHTIAPRLEGGTQATRPPIRVPCTISPRRLCETTRTTSLPIATLKERVVQVAEAALSVQMPWATLALVMPPG